MKTNEQQLRFSNELTALTVRYGELADELSELHMPDDKEKIIEKLQEKRSILRDMEELRDFYIMK